MDSRVGLLKPNSHLEPRGCSYPPIHVVLNTLSFPNVVESDRESEPGGDESDLSYD